MTIASQKDLIYQLALWRTPEIGSKHFFAIREQFPDLADFFKLKTFDLQALGLRTVTIEFLQNEALKQAEKDLAWQDDLSKHIVCFNEKSYPQQLKQTAYPPPLLFIEGDRECLQARQIAIVGSRNPTTYGTELATQFAYELSLQGLVITSGLALGIDGSSHHGALTAKGKTIAVLGTSLDNIYPKRHEKLAQQMKESGALVSEFPMGTSARPENFPRRNRIISGLSLGVLVIEAGIQSGSLITAHYAIEQGRDVFALPGSIHQPLSKGCHQLIRQGAILVENVVDILKELGNTFAIDAKKPLSNDQFIKHENNFMDQHDNLSDHHKKILSTLNFDITTIDSIIQRSELSAREVTACLLELELMGSVRAAPGGYELIKR